MWNHKSSELHQKLSVGVEDSKVITCGRHSTNINTERHAATTCRIQCLFIKLEHAEDYRRTVFSCLLQVSLRQDGNHKIRALIKNPIAGTHRPKFMQKLFHDCIWAKCEAVIYR